MPFRRAMLGLACALVALACSTPQADPSPAADARPPDAVPGNPASDPALCCRDADRVVLRFDGAPADAFKGPGWYRNEHSDNPTWGTFAWAAKRALVYFATPLGAELDLVATCAPFESESSPPQSVRLVLNGNPVATRPMHRGWHELRVPLPKEALDDAVNTLALEFAHSEQPKTGDSRSLSAACRQIGIVLRGSSDLEPRVRWDDQTRTLHLRPGARTAIPLPAARSFDVAVGEVTADAASRLSLSVLDTSGQATELWRGPAVRAAGLALPVRLQGATASDLVIEVSAPGTELAREAVVLPLPRAILSTPPVDAGPAPGPLDVFVYMIDTLRADALGAYGGRPSSSPRIDRFASDAVVYERAWSTSAWTLPATASVLTGLYPPNHGSRTGEVRQSDPPLTLGGLLAARGFDTLFVSQSYVASSTYGLDAGFTNSYLNDVLGTEMQASDRVRWFIWRYLRRRPYADRPVFAYLHTVDPHHPYVRSARPRDGRHAEKPMTLTDGPGVVHDPTDLRRFRALYDGEVAYADRQFGALLDLLKARGLYDSSLIILVSDHGEEFGEHGGLYHSRTLFEELLEIPLVVKYPHSWNAGARVRRRVSNVDVAATVLDVLDLPSPDLDGVSLRTPLREGADDDRIVFAETAPHATNSGHYAPIALTAAVRGPLKCIRAGTDTDRYFRPVPPLRAFDLGVDPEEHSPVSDFGSRDDCAEMMEAWERTSRVKETPARDVGPDTKSRLRALGYLD